MAAASAGTGGTAAPASIHRRLRTLAVLEFGNIPLQAWLWFSQIGLPVSAPNAVGFVLFAVLLVQGGAYWAAKLRQVRLRAEAPAGLVVYRWLRLVNVPVLAAGAAYTGHAVTVDPGRAAVPGMVFLVVAVLEYVNYFHVQLMHDNRADVRRLRRLGFRKSHLARDLTRRRGARAG